MSKLERARKALEAAKDRRDAWDDRRIVLQREVAEAERRFGQEVAAGDAYAIQRLREARDKVEAAEAAVWHCEAEAELAERKVQEAEATQLEAQAKRIRSEIESRQRTTDRLLGELRKHEEVEYVPKPPPSPEQRAATGGVYSYRVPRTRAMADQARKLEHQAAEIRRKLAAISRQEQQERAERARRDWLAWERKRFLEQERADADRSDRARQARGKAPAGRAHFPDQEGWTEDRR